LVGAVPALESRAGKSFPDGCSGGTCLHEIGHAVGLKHTMQRTDRDKFVSVDLTHPKYDSQFEMVSGDEFSEIATDKIPGADKVLQAKNVYSSIMMYGATSGVQRPIPDYWAVDKNALTQPETTLLSDFAKSDKFMGQRTNGLNPFDLESINGAYDCHAVKLKDAYADVKSKIGQTVLQVIKKIELNKKGTVGFKPTSVTLFKTDTTAANEQPYTTVLDSKDTEYIVKVLDTCLTFKTSDTSYELCVDLTWKLPRVKANLKTFHDLNVATFKKGATPLTDEAKTLTELTLANGETVDITLA